ncbi:MAG TPA: DPP IV N-terminal domain-containing protein [Candidatus Baltobacteraceae bacterium]|jgi:dipeptidyl-peptidase-4|nr:DPP IV N-terminal domain-containing protein [Candidatus Baltobacteraceae bacterium]
MAKRLLTAVLSLALCISAARPSPAAGDLTLDTIFAAQPPWGSQPDRIVWSGDGRSFLYVLPTQDPAAALPVHQYDVSSGNDRVVIDPKTYGKDAKTPENLTWAPDGKAIAFVEKETLYVRDLSTNLDREIDKQVSDPQWSPHADAIAYVKNGDLYAARLTPKLSVRRMTAGGSDDAILNGGLDWVYPEELGTEHGFAWSGDQKFIAYVQMDERPVTAFPIADFLKTDNSVTLQRYPLAGERNPRAVLRVVDVSDGRDRLLYDAGARDEYLPFIAWKPQSDSIVAETLDRAQQHLRVFTLSATTGAQTTLYSQSDSKWVGAVEGNGDVRLPLWLANGSTLWVLDRNGVSALYLRSASGALRRLTGTYRVLSLEAVDAKTASAYVVAAYPTRRDTALLRIPLAGGPPADLTPLPGAHQVSVAQAATYFVDQHSTLNDPPQTDLAELQTGSIRATLTEQNRDLRAQLLPTQMLSVDSAYGKLDATMLKPPNFDPQHKYPVIVYVYGGPSAPVTANVFAGQRQLYHQLLARRGFIVFSIDGPASQIDNDAHVQLLYHNFGPGSLVGQQIGAQYLRSLPYVDPGRIGIWGWSFGGYETIYALTHSSSFKAGAAVAPVTDWHYYDTIYTERYMGTPQNDPKAYDVSSNVKAASNLHGDLLISHGTSDDNVHMANTVSMLQAFIQADKVDVDFFAYPRRTHSIAGIAQRRHLYEHMLDWWTAHL